MAKNRKHISTRASDFEEGGQFGFPPGSVVTITEAKWGTWEEAGEKALKGQRKAEDPVLILTGEVEGSDVQPPPVFLGAGKATRFVASSDGEFLEPADESSATALNKSCNAAIFLASAQDKKRQGKMALPEDTMDDGASAIVGLKFRAGAAITEREFSDDGAGGGGSKKQSSLVSEENLKLPKGAGKAKGSSKDDDEDEDEAPPKKKKPAKDEDEDEKDNDKDDDGEEGDAEEIAEGMVVQVLSQPKYRKGIKVEDEVFPAVFAIAKKHAQKKDILEFVKDEDWLKHKKRAWNYDDEKETLTLEA